MKAYIRMVGISVKQGLEFRARIFMWLLVHLSAFTVVPFFWVYVLFLQPNVEYTPEKIATYYVLIVLVSCFSASNIGNRIEEDILEGGIVGLMVKPVSYVKYRFALFLGGKVVPSTIVIVLFGLARLLFPTYILLPTSFVHGVFFVLFVCVASTITFFLDVLVSLGAFWWGRTPALGQSLVWLRGLFGGQFAPLVFYPAAIVSLAKVLPFQFLYAIPANVYLGEYDITTVYHLLVGGVIWIMALALMATFIWKKGIRTYDSPSQ